MTPKITEVQKPRLTLNKSMQDLKMQTVALENALKGADQADMAADVTKLRAARKTARNHRSTDSTRRWTSPTTSSG